MKIPMKTHTTDVSAGLSAHMPVAKKYSLTPNFQGQQFRPIHMCLLRGMKQHVQSGESVEPWAMSQQPIGTCKSCECLAGYAVYRYVPCFVHTDKPSFLYVVGC
jgi:hypothetical protein